MLFTLKPKRGVDDVLPSFPSCVPHEPLTNSTRPCRSETITRRTGSGIDRCIVTVTSMIDEAKSRFLPLVFGWLI